MTAARFRGVARNCAGEFENLPDEPNPAENSFNALNARSAMISKIMKLVIIIARTGLLALLLAIPFVALAETESEGKLSDSEIKKILIRQSIAGYSGNCPCPYNTDRAGRRCGGRSAWSRPGGASPLCYEGDVTQSRVDAYRKKNSKPTVAQPKKTASTRSVRRPSSRSSSSGRVYVRGYYRKDGTYVKPHYRSKPKKR